MNPWPFVIAAYAVMTGCTAGLLLWAGGSMRAAERSADALRRPGVKAKHQRLALVSLALVAVLGAILLAMWGLRDRASYFYTPSDIAAGRAVDAGDRTIRLGGMVEKGSLVRATDGVTVRFVVSDGPGKTPVRFRGVLPDLFREGSGVVAEGHLSGTTFTADTILAKHDERYMPPQMGNQAAEHRAGKTLQR